MGGRDEWYIGLVNEIRKSILTWEILSTYGSLKASATDKQQTSWVNWNGRDKHCTNGDAGTPFAIFGGGHFGCSTIIAARAPTPGRLVAIYINMEL